GGKGNGIGSGGSSARAARSGLTPLDSNAEANAPPTSAPTRIERRSIEAISWILLGLLCPNPNRTPPTGRRSYLSCSRAIPGASPARGGRALRGGDVPRRRLLRQDHAKRRPASRHALDLDAAAVVRDDVVHDREPEPGPLP